MIPGRSALGLTVASILVLVVSACGSPAPTPTSPISPLPTPAGTVGPVTLEGPVFSINQPLKKGATQVSGIGPYGVPINIVDVTLLGQILGRGQIGSDGRFNISVQPPLIVNHRIGIMLDTQSTALPLTPDVLAQLQRFLGPNAITIPQVGELYDAASVQP